MNQASILEYESHGVLMPRVKRVLPPEMVEADKQIENWRSSLLESIHPRVDIAIYLLVSVISRRIRDEFVRLMPNNSGELEHLVRTQLSGLQFAISGLKGELPKGKFVEDIIKSSLTTQHERRAENTVDQMYNYSLVRDCFLTYIWGGYEVESPAENTLRFVNSPDWPGIRDRAQQIIAQQIKQEQILASRSKLILPFKEMLEKIIEVLPALSIDGLTAEQFVTAWSSCLTVFGQRWYGNHSLVVEKDNIISTIQANTGLSPSEVERFIALVTFDRNQSHALSLFHCPLIPVSTSSLLVFTPGFIFGNPSTCIPRLAVHRGAGLGAYSNAIEGCLLNRLVDHFNTNDVVVRTRIPYSTRSDKGDIDLLVYEIPRNRILIAMAKGFIHPDTVEEVIRANDALENGLNQVERARVWLNGTSRDLWAKVLNIPVLNSSANTELAVVGNGFAGSDYLQVPKDVNLVDAKFLMMSKLAGQSIFSAIAEYQRRISEKSIVASQHLQYSSILVGNLTVHVPSWQVAVS